MTVLSTSSVKMEILRAPEAYQNEIIFYLKIQGNYFWN
jgi:hypothetical protein